MVTVLLKFNVPASVNSKLAEQSIVPSASNVPVDNVTLPLEDMVVVPLTSNVCELISNMAPEPLTVKLLVTFVVPPDCRDLVDDPLITKL